MCSLGLLYKMPCVARTMVLATHGIFYFFLRHTAFSTSYICTKQWCFHAGVRSAINPLTKSRDPLNRNTFFDFRHYLYVAIECKQSLWQARCHDVFLAILPIFDLHFPFCWKK